MNSNNQKFRAWDKCSNQWIYFTLDDVLNGNNYVLAHTMIGGACPIEWDEVAKLEKTQYTGLTDKNGKEAYFGDIFRNHEGELLIIDKDVNGVHWRTKLVGKGYEYGDIYQVLKGEIVGNIWAFGSAR